MDKMQRILDRTNYFISQALQVICLNILYIGKAFKP